MVLVLNFWDFDDFGQILIVNIDFADLGLILDDCLMIFSIMWASFYLACLITLLVTSSFHFQISGHKFKFVGVVRRGQYDVAHPSSCLPLGFCYLEPYFSRFWP